MKDWEANEPKNSQKILKVLEGIAKKAGASVADTIILAGNVALEKAIKKAGSKVKFHLAQVEVTLSKSKLKSRVLNG